MLTMRTLLFTFFVYASFAVALTNAAYFRVRSSHGDSTGNENVETTFTRLLSAVSPQALHQLLHEYAPNAFKQGVLSSDRHAVEAAHPRSSAVASTIVHLAIRQATSGNDTTTTDAPTSTDSSTDSSSTPSTTSDTPSTTSTDEPTTTSTEQTPTETTETPQDTPTSSSSALTTAPTSTSTSISTPASATETAETTDITDTPSRTSSSSWHTSAFSSNVDSTTTSTFSTSTTPTPTSKTSTFTSTLPGGIVTTVTEVAVVTPGVTDGDSTPTTDIGNLQTGSAAPIVRGPGFEILAGFLVGGVMLA
ncbi:hypothetical protein GQX73_g3242 [Xylaria multiplex]|uniref:Uncharacterized protein n=1 Tax=Xylaria multiplex TaxID=323545 RepID=A0A7C8N7P5_9PEZI|nr:hypothetical protein GQX73_g3242 [Xylaria multiplex]